MKEFWLKVKEFAERLKSDIREIFGKKRKEEQPIKTIMVESEPGVWEEQPQEPAPKKKKQTWTAKMLKKAGDNIKKFVESAIDEPAKFMAILTGAAGAVMFVLSAIDKFDHVVRDPIRKRRDDYIRSMDYYDNRTGKHLMLNRPLTPEQINEVNIQTSMGVPAAIALQRMGYLAGF